MFDDDKVSRKLAKTNKYQLLYSHFKEGNLNLFHNAGNFTDLQVRFLHWLSFYNSLFLDIYMEEVDEKVLEDEIYEDAYMYYKQTQKKKDKQDISKRDNKKVRGSSSKWVFPKPTRRK